MPESYHYFKIMPSGDQPRILFRRVVLRNLREQEGGPALVTEELLENGEWGTICYDYLVCTDARRSLENLQAELFRDQGHRWPSERNFRTYREARAALVAELELRAGVKLKEYESARAQLLKARKIPRSEPRAVGPVG